MIDPELIAKRRARIDAVVDAVERISARMDAVLARADARDVGKTMESLRRLAEHPNTPPHEAANAREKLERLRGTASTQPPPSGDDYKSLFNYHKTQASAANHPRAKQLHAEAAKHYQTAMRYASAGVPHAAEYYAQHGKKSGQGAIHLTKRFG